MRTVIQRFICWAIETVLPVKLVGGMRVYDLRYSEDTVPTRVVDAAAKYFARADDRFRGLVSENLQMVVASGFQDAIYTSTGAYFTRLQGLEARSPLYFASRLVWVATYIRLVRGVGGKSERRSTEVECAMEQLAFLDSVGEEAEWIKSLRDRLNETQAVFQTRVSE